MIVDDPNSHFIFVVPKEHVYTNYNYIQYKGNELTNKEYLDHWGKWIILGSRKQLDDYAKRIDPFVEKKQIPAAKYDRKKIDAFQLDDCVMCVYCHYRQRGDVWEILEKQLKLSDKAWVFEKETMERWLPGGHLLEKWIAAQGFSTEQADRVRQGAIARFDMMFGDDNAIFRGVNQ